MIFVPSYYSDPNNLLKTMTQEDEHQNGNGILKKQAWENNECDLNKHWIRIMKMIECYLHLSLILASPESWWSEWMICVYWIQNCSLGCILKVN